MAAATCIATTFEKRRSLPVGALIPDPFFTSTLKANLPTPWIGLWERINISVFLLWVAVLATVLLRNQYIEGATHHVSRISVQES